MYPRLNLNLVRDTFEAVDALNRVIDNENKKTRRPQLERRGVAYYTGNVVAIDEGSSGYSSFKRLTELVKDVLKEEVTAETCTQELREANPVVRDIMLYYKRFTEDFERSQGKGLHNLLFRITGGRKQLEEAKKIIEEYNRNNNVRSGETATVNFTENLGTVDEIIKATFPRRIPIVRKFK